jgi:hypothetical protein
MEMPYYDIDIVRYVGPKAAIDFLKLTITQKTRIQECRTCAYLQLSRHQNPRNVRICQ